MTPELLGDRAPGCPLRTHFAAVKANTRVLRFEGAVLDGRQSLVARLGIPAAPQRASPSHRRALVGHRDIGLPQQLQRRSGSRALPWLSAGRSHRPEADLEVCLHSGDCPEDWD